MGCSSICQAWKINSLYYLHKIHLSLVLRIRDTYHYHLTRIQFCFPQLMCRWFKRPRFQLSCQPYQWYPLQLKQVLLACMWRHQNENLIHWPYTIIFSGVIVYILHLEFHAIKKIIRNQLKKLIETRKRMQNVFTPNYAQSERKRVVSVAVWKLSLPSYAKVCKFDFFQGKISFNTRHIIIFKTFTK